MVPFWPVEGQCGSLVAIFLVFLDYVLQPLKDFSPGYIKDSLHLIQELMKLGPILDGSFLFTSDAESMYMHIAPEEGLAILSLYFEEFKHKLPDSFSVDVVLKLLELVSQWNIFKF
eukprot:2827975-Ditylum_brightwellii.AAC.1